MVEFTRRGLLKVGGGAGLGASMLAAAKTLGLPSNAKPIPALTPEGMAVGVQTIEDVVEAAPNPLRQLLRSLERKNERRWQVRNTDCIDPDIACLKSVSPAMKRQMQFSRIAQHEDIVQRVRELVYPRSLGEPSCEGQTMPVAGTGY